MSRFLFVVLLALAAGCAVPFPEPVTPREAFVKYPGAGQYKEHHGDFTFPLGVPVTIVEDAR